LGLRLASYSANACIALASGAIADGELMQVSYKQALSNLNKGDDVVVKYVSGSAVSIEPEDTSARRSSGQDGQSR